MGHQRTIWITVGADGALAWPEGDLVVPDGFVGKLDGYPEGTIVEVVGSYERVDARTKTLTIQRLKVADTPIERAVERWRRVQFGDDPKSRPEWQSFVDALSALRRDTSPTAMMLRAWVCALDGQREEFLKMFQEALTLDTRGAEHLVRTLYKKTTDVERSAFSDRHREEVVRSVWRSLPGWEWVHPFVKSLWMRPEYPLHFGGPRPDADENALRAWVDRRVREIATDAELQQIADMERLTPRQRRELVSGLRAEEDAKHDQAYSDMVRAWNADPKNHYDSPPDSVAVTWTEESRLLPARWCALMSDQRDYQDRLQDAPPWLLGFWKERGRDADAFAQLADAVCVVSALDTELVEEFERVVFAHAQLLNGYALVELRDGRGCVLEAKDGAFGAWTHRVDSMDVLVASLPHAELAGLALKQGTLGRSPESLRIASLTQEPIEDIESLPARARKRKMETEKPRWVVHKRHGRGLVVGSIPGPKGPKLVIEFETVGRKTLLHSFVQDE